MMYKVIENARVQAFEPPIVQVPNGFRGGPVLEDASDFPLRHTRNRRPVDSFRAFAEYKNTLGGSYVYAGPIDGHFGHFMAEMVHRILPAKQLGLAFPFLFVSSLGWNPYPTYDKFPAMVKEILAFLQVRGDAVTVISEDTLVQELHILESGSDLDAGPKPGYLDAIRPFSQTRLDNLHGSTSRPEKLYVSRSALLPQGSLLGETLFEDQLAREGFTIFRPEEFHFTAQMDYYRKAKALIFLEGSACHGTELLGTAMMNRTFLMPRREGQIHVFQRILAPRSVEYNTMDRCVDYLGSALVDPQTQDPLSHYGVSSINIEATVAFLRRHGLALLPNLTRRNYAAAAAADLQRYLSFHSIPKPAELTAWVQWSDKYVNELTASLSKKLAVK